MAWTIVFLSICVFLLVMQLWVIAKTHSLLLRDALGETEPRRLASGGTGSCVAVPSTEVVP